MPSTEAAARPATDGLRAGRSAARPWRWRTGPASILEAEAALATTAERAQRLSTEAAVDHAWQSLRRVDRAPGGSSRWRGPGAGGLGAARAARGAPGRREVRWTWRPSSGHRGCLPGRAGVGAGPHRAPAAALAARRRAAVRPRPGARRCPSIPASSSPRPARRRSGRGRPPCSAAIPRSRRGSSSVRSAERPRRRRGSRWRCQGGWSWCFLPRPAARASAPATFLWRGWALHLAATEADAPVEHRWMGDRAVRWASGWLVRGLLWNERWLQRAMHLGRAAAREVARRPGAGGADRAAGSRGAASLPRGVVGARGDRGAGLDEASEALSAAIGVRVGAGRTLGWMARLDPELRTAAGRGAVGAAARRGRPALRRRGVPQPARRAVATGGVGPGRSGDGGADGPGAVWAAAGAEPLAREPGGGAGGLNRGGTTACRGGRGRSSTWSARRDAGAVLARAWRRSCSSSSSSSSASSLPSGAMRASGASARTPTPCRMRSARSSTGVRVRSRSSPVRSSSVVTRPLPSGVRSIVRPRRRPGLNGRSEVARKTRAVPTPYGPGRGDQFFDGAAPGGPKSRPLAALSGRVVVGLGVDPGVGPTAAGDAEPVQGVGQALGLVGVGQEAIGGLDDRGCGRRRGCARRAPAGARPRRPRSDPVTSSRPTTCAWRTTALAASTTSSPLRALGWRFSTKVCRRRVPSSIFGCAWREAPAPRRRTQRRGRHRRGGPRSGRPDVPRRWWVPWRPARGDRRRASRPRGARRRCRSGCARRCPGRAGEAGTCRTCSGRRPGRGPVPPPGPGRGCCRCGRGSRRPRRRPRPRGVGSR